MKAKADVNFINQRVGKYKSEIGSLSKQLGDKFNEILNLAIAAVAREIAEDTTQVWLAAAVMDRSAKLERSLTESGKVALLDNIISISSRFQNNIGVLEQIFLL